MKNVVQENHCSWSKRLRLYNQFVQGNAELLSISSNDSIWNSDAEVDIDEESTNHKRKQPPRSHSSDADFIGMSIRFASKCHYILCF